MPKCYHQSDIIYIYIYIYLYLYRQYWDFYKKWVILPHGSTCWNQKAHAYPGPIGQLDIDLGGGEVFWESIQMIFFQRFRCQKIVKRTRYVRYVLLKFPHFCQSQANLKYFCCAFAFLCARWLKRFQLLLSSLAPDETSASCQYGSWPSRLWSVMTGLRWEFHWWKGFVQGTLISTLTLYLFFWCVFVV